jgi:hypothetical protein
VKVKPKKQKLKDFAPEKVEVKDDFDKALIIGSKEWVARKHVEEKRAAQAKGDETGPNHKPPASLSLAVNFYEKKTIQKLAREKAEAWAAGEIERNQMAEDNEVGAVALLFS